MTLRISGKHMDVGDSLKGKIEDRINDAVDKYFGHGFSGHVNMEKQGAFFTCDCMLRLDSGVTLQASARENDAHVSFDQAADRIEKRLRRYKRKLKDHHAGNSNDDFPPSPIQLCQRRLMTKKSPKISLLWSLRKAR